MIILFLYSRNYIIFYISGLYNPKMHPACQKHGEIKDNSADYMVLSCNPKTWMQRRKTCRCSLVNYCVKHQQCRDKKLIYTILQMLEFSLKRSSYTIIDFRIIIQMMIFFYSHTLDRSQIFLTLHLFHFLAFTGTQIIVIPNKSQIRKKICTITDILIHPFIELVLVKKFTIGSI